MTSKKNYLLISLSLFSVFSFTQTIDPSLLSQLSPDAIKKMKDSINDCRNNDINVKIEKERFQSGFKSGLIMDKIRQLKIK